MPRKAGTLVRATCCVCGMVEMAPGTSHMRRCLPCKKAGQFLPPQASHADIPAQVAKGRVASAVRDGILPKASTLKCVDCGAQAQVWEHRDYSKPLDVEPCCKKCNARRGPAANGGMVTRQDLRADWSAIWPELTTT